MKQLRLSISRLQVSSSTSLYKMLMRCELHSFLAPAASPSEDRSFLAAASVADVLSTSTSFSLAQNNVCTSRCWRLSLGILNPIQNSLSAHSLPVPLLRFFKSQSRVNLYITKTTPVGRRSDFRNILAFGKANAFDLLLFVIFCGTGFLVYISFNQVLYLFFRDGRRVLTRMLIVTSFVLVLLSGGVFQNFLFHILIFQGPTSCG